MQVWLLLFMALGLAADAAAVSVVNGIFHPHRPIRLGLACGAAFGFFQALMPLVGCLVGISSLSVIGGIDHWAAFFLLAVVGGRMTVEALRQKHNPGTAQRLSLRILLLQAFATSVDALAVGIGLGIIGADMALAICLIGLVTFICCFAGVQLGRLAGSRFSLGAQLLGGVMLMLIGLHILLEHLWVRYR